jgi:hypothetical protein
MAKKLQRLENQGGGTIFTYEPENIKFIQFHNNRNPFDTIKEMYGELKSLQNQSVNEFHIVTIDIGNDEKTYRLVTRFGDVYLTTATEVLNRETNGGYENVCARCGTTIRSLTPAEQKYLDGISQPYLCPTCERRRAATFTRFEGANNFVRTSKFEDLIAVILKSIGVYFNRGRSIYTPVGFAIADFYIPCANLIIEANGIRFHTGARMIGTTVDGIIHGAFRDMQKFDTYIRAGYNVLVLHETDFGMKGMNYEKAIGNEYYNIIKKDITKILKQHKCTGLL